MKNISGQLTKFPTGVPHLAASLADVDGHDFSHSRHFDNFLGDFRKLLGDFRKSLGDFCELFG